MPRLRLLPVMLAVLAGSALGWARPPQGLPVDPVLHGWFESLKQPGSGYPCCSIADCRTTEYRMSATGYEVLLADGWVSVPEDRVLVGQTNPTGHAVVCRAPVSDAILCFVPASET